VDVRADIYSLGCTFFFLLTGRPPFDGETDAQTLLMHQQQEPPAIELLRPDVPPGVSAVLRRMLVKRPEQRFSTPAEVAAALGPYASWEGSPLGPGGAVPAPAAPSLVAPQAAGERGWTLLVDGTQASPSLLTTPGTPERGWTLLTDAPGTTTGPGTAPPSRPSLPLPEHVPDRPAAAPSLLTAPAAAPERGWTLLAEPEQLPAVMRVPVPGGPLGGRRLSGLQLGLILGVPAALLLLLGVLLVWLVWPSAPTEIRVANNAGNQGPQNPPGVAPKQPEEPKKGEGKLEDLKKGEEPKKAEGKKPEEPKKIESPKKVEEPKKAEGPKEPTKLAADSVFGDARKVGEATVYESRFPTQGVPPCICWAPDGKSVFVLESDKGLLRRIALSPLGEERRLELGGGCNWISPSARGLLVTSPKLGELWLVDPAALKVTDTFKAPGVLQALSSPALSVALAVDATQGRLTTFDLTRGGVGQTYAVRDFKGLFGFGLMAVTPDGKYLFAAGPLGQLHRFRIDRDRLVHEQAGPTIGSNAQRIDVSPDSKYVCLPSGGGNARDLPGHPPIGPYGTYVYPVSDLTKPAFGISQGPYPRAVAFDPKAGLVYSQNFDKELLVFSDKGEKRYELQLGGRGNEPRQLLAHPQGHRVLVLTGSKLYYVELPRR
jgi:hypothetical protein